MNRKNKSEKKPFLILTLICLCVLTYGIYSHYSKKNELEKVPETTIGTIDKKYSIISRGYYINYNYEVDGQKYSGTEKLNKTELEKVNVGDKFKVTYSENNPKYSEILFENRIEK
ncbi:hypothetical protein DFR65_11219 [Oceanihabitans sediminis]|uniref:DUF3592 domain-containing protein n=1 Tax=Oceanihabitans sediminis TaxID=1812012 RepID=UPI000DFCD30D|nr:hypothetical protein [Oceanihabitans sediminis]RBP27041.1 hypothetical protein DFR65_11219 [Oceanihabitans sediminis]